MPRSSRPTVFMMDLWATVPYYTAYLSRALLDQGVDVMIGSISYYLPQWLIEVINPETIPMMRSQGYAPFVFHEGVFRPSSELPPVANYFFLPA